MHSPRDLHGAWTSTRHSCIDPAYPTSTLINLPARRPSILNHEASPLPVLHSRQSMSRGGKLAPEVNRYVRPSLHGVPTARLLRPTHTTPPLTRPCSQSSIRKELEVGSSPDYISYCALTLCQLQRHSRGTLRSLWQVRPGAVRRRNSMRSRILPYTLGSGH
jgi:hypothetical protein